MGQITLTSLQKVVFDEFSQNNILKKDYYFGGGTALSVYYLHHRYSDDLDFFSEKDLDKEFLIEFVNRISKKLNMEIKMTKKDTVLLFQLKHNKELLKIDFLHFPYPRIDKGLVDQGVEIDSVQDIGANKLLTINLHSTVKDYVDLFFILKEKHTLWDLLYAVEAKYKMKLDLIGLGEDFLNVKQFDYMPRMIKPLKLEELKSFFEKLSRDVGDKTVKD
jgi:predicted nucleotidyltransferase component of viral defense system